MQAIRYTEYGGPEVLKFEDIPVPEPGSGEVLVQVKNVALNPLDWRMVRAEPFLVRPHAGFIKPKKHGLGADFSGIVEKVHAGVSQFAAGDNVFGTVFPNDLGALAEYVLVPESSIIKKPESLPFPEASTFGVAALTALQGILKYKSLGPESTILINGASGGIGTFAIQIAKATGSHVVAISSTKNHALTRSLGADTTICYHQTPINELNEGPFDLIYDAVGTYSANELKKHLKPEGQLVFASAKNSLGFLKKILEDKLSSETHMIVELDKGQAELTQLVDLYLAGKLKPIIDRTYPFEDTAAAFAYIETMRARGKVVIDMSI